MPRKKPTPYINKSHGMRKYDKLCCDIFGIDSNIRFAAIYDKGFNRLAGGLRKGLKSHFTRDQLNEAIHSQFKEWETFHVLQKQVGAPQYSVVRYDKTVLTTFFLNVDELLFVSLEPLTRLEYCLTKIRYYLMTLH